MPSAAGSLTGLLLAAHALELLRRHFNGHEPATLLVSLGRGPRQLVLELGTLLHRALAGVVADRLVDSHRYAPVLPDQQPRTPALGSCNGTPGGGGAEPPA